MFSIILLLLGWAPGFYFQKENQDKEISGYPEKDPLINLHHALHEATLKYFWVVTGLILLQILMGLLPSLV